MELLWQVHASCSGTTAPSAGPAPIRPATADKRKGPHSPDDRGSAGPSWDIEGDANIAWPYPWLLEGEVVWVGRAHNSFLVPGVIVLIKEESRSYFFEKQGAKLSR